MSIFRLGDQRPPDPQPIADGVVMRFEHVYEVDPALMELTGQQDLPAWDTRRIVDARSVRSRSAVMTRSCSRGKCARYCSTCSA